MKQNLKAPDNYQTRELAIEASATQPLKLTYGLTEEHYSLNADTRIAYGIAAYANADEDGTATIVASIHDITSNKQALAELVSLCNRLELSPIHLYDVVEDFLAN